MDRASNWDAIVIGAGPAGSVAAYLLAREGLQVLLVEAKPFPRAKVCGGCLNGRALAMLKSIGLGQIAVSCQGQTIDRIRIHQGRRTAEFPLPPGLSISRSTLDTLLVDAAISAGVTFVDQAKCKVLATAEGSSHRTILWSSRAGQTYSASAPIVLACDGLGHPSLHDLTEVQAAVARQSRVGLGTVLENGGVLAKLPPGAITMAVANEGYVGLARAEAQRISVAAAVDPHALRGGTTPALILQRILDAAGLDGLCLHAGTPLRGTPPVTQCATTVAAERLLLVGDSAGYVEPFTGEGMMAAIEGAIRVAPLALSGARRWQPQLAVAWQNLYARHIRRRQRTCRTIAWWARHPRVVRWSLAGLAVQPRIGETLGRWIGHDSTGKGCDAL